MAPWVAQLIAAGGVLWVLLLVTAPIVWTPLAAVLYGGGAFICHQLSDRSFHLWDAQLPVCARCLGLYAGGAAGSLVAAAALAGSPSWRRAVTPLSRSAWGMTVLAALPTLGTLALEYGAGLPVSNVVRAAAAMPFAAMVAVVVMAAPTLHYVSCAPPRPIESSQPPTST